MTYRYYIDQKKYRIKPNERYIRINGWCFEEQGRKFSYRAEINGKPVECSIKTIIRPDVQEKFKNKFKVPADCGVHIKVYVQEGINPEKFRLYLVSEKEQKCIVYLDRKRIEKSIDDSTISYRLDYVHADQLKILGSGWATSIKGSDGVTIRVKEKDSGKDVEVRLQRQKRNDILNAGFIGKEDINCGFTFEFIHEPNRTYILVIEDGIKRKKIPLDVEQIRKYENAEKVKSYLAKFVKSLNKENIEKGIHFVKKHGIRGFRKQIISFLNKGKDYQKWFEENRVTEEELKRQRNERLYWTPKISIIVPTYKTPEVFLREMIESVVNQSYTNWELCIADGSGGDKSVEKILKEYADCDERVRFKILEDNLGISGNTNAALEMTTGEYVGLFDHDDVLTPNALYEVVHALQKVHYDILYTDEDKMSGDGTAFNDPNFKPDFSMDLFRSHNYITHFFVVKTDIIKKIGGFRSEFDGSQDYDLMFRCIENAESIKHIPKVLYHWRIHENSVAGDPSSKMYAYEAGKHAIEEHLKRVGIKATVEHVGLWGMYHVKYEVVDEPKLSIIIPNKDHVKDLDTCIKSIQTKSTYKNYEFIIVENNSVEEETFNFYKTLEENFENIKVVTWDGIFNYSAINNFGVQYATGDYLLFLNNDTEMITETALSEMVGICLRDEVGAVGAKLLYEDDTVQHAGIVIGFGNYAGHVNTGIGRDDYGYMVRARINCNYSAVTAACLLTKKKTFEQVGGFDEQFAVACNDVDFCLKLRAEEKLVVYNAFSEWYHYESKSRGYEDTPEKLKRFEDEVEKFQKKWPGILKDGDPYYNPNFAINQAPFTLA
ncbi:glycosyltransferase family 2 protein [Faecalicatena sp. AGMB00832]|uniref:Glycosyltransferase family 2 protein n=1 Tax=Faecalicatena faecalis TaxID=2726362 RepID=A0ABS6CZG8_9FIRM|nr:glycosyltransferase family 2 protein [Faecalicatena faecalis]MBU3874727.1 glycosyltransferase family 2 protein [Faecalicatena faecalis]